MAEGKRTILHEGQYVRFVDRDGWEYAERLGSSGIVIILAVNDRHELVLVEQYRAAVDRQMVELPAGLVGDLPGAEHEDFATAGERELLEETGYAADSMEFLADGFPSAGMSTESLSLYRARGIRRVAAGGGDESEDIIVHEVPCAEILPWLEEQKAAGKGVDIKIYAGLYFIDPPSGP